MRALVRLGLLLLVLLGGMGVLATSPRPAVERPAQLSLADIERARAILQRLGVRHLREGQVSRVSLNRNDLAVGINHLLTGIGQGRASLALGERRLTLRASWRLPYLPRYLNVKLVLAESGEMLRPVELKLGRLPLPAGLAGDTALRVLARTPYGPQFAVARDMLRQARVRDQALHLEFVWHGQAVARAFSPSGVDPATLDAYRQALTRQRGREFAGYLGTAMALAQSRAAGNDPVAENRAALTALAEIVLGGKLVSAQGIAQPPRRAGVKLAGRVDAAQHFAVSAYLAATGGSNLSDLAGLYKELRDARGGSGFSFADLAADRAGSRLGTESVASAAAARRMQKRLAGSRKEGSFFPGLGGLPEFMSESQFHRRFGGVGQPAYVRMVERIDQRIAGLAIYRD